MKINDPERILLALEEIEAIFNVQSDADEILDQILKKLLELFSCDRAWLLYPCNPDSPTFEVAYERTTPLFPGAKALNAAVPMTRDMAENCNRALSNNGYPEINVPSDQKGNNDRALQFDVKSRIFMALKPKNDYAWLFGMHHCAINHHWNDDEKYLFKIIGQRITKLLENLILIKQTTESEERFRNLMENVEAVAVQGYGFDGTTQYWNKASERLYGYTQQEAIGRSLLDLIIPPEMRGAVTEEMRKMVETGEPVPSGELLLMHKDGSRVPVISHHTIVRVPGRAQELFCLDIDITERKQAETTLRQSEEKFRTLVNTAPFGIQLTDLEGRIVYSNPAHHHIQGCEPNQLIGMYLWDLIAHDSDRAKTRDYYQYIISKEPEPSIYFSRDRTRDGRKIDVQITWDYIRNEKDGVTGIISIIEDITERNQADAERKILQEQLNQAQKMEAVGRLAGGVAHDFNNMLGVILGYVELASEKIDSNQDLYSDLKEIQKAAQRSADLTKQLLTFARKQIIAPKMLDLNDTVDSMLKILRRLIGEDIDLIWLPGAQLWPIKIDPTQIDQILANLCVNARDAITDVGKLTIETQTKVFDQEYCARHTGFMPGDYVMLSVTDNGCGMNKETLDNLFEPFFTTKEIGKGTGLGLATIYGIVKQNKGFINVYSEPGQGTTFKIYLPRFYTSEEIHEKTLREKPAPIGNETILLVEDEPAILEMARMMLERKGYLVLPAATPAEAIRIADTYVGKIDLLMTDVVMPEMNGRNLSKKITAIFPEIKLLFMSGYSANVITQQGVLDDGVAFMQKPFSMNELAEKIRGVLDDNQV